jgi:RNA polymerase sigma-70 factor, ECF subfamily
MAPQEDMTSLLAKAREGDRAAGERLLQYCRPRLCRMVSARLDDRLVARVDASDVVQEALAEAARQLSAYLASEPLPFFPWLRQLAWNRLMKLHRHHLNTQKRSLRRERRTADLGLSDGSLHEFASFLATASGGPLQRLLHLELKERVALAIGKLAERDREVLVMRYLEGLTNSEVAASLAISEAAVRVRHSRALDRLHDHLLEFGEDD